MKSVLKALTLFILLTAGAYAQDRRVPRFADYPAPLQFTGKPAPTKIIGRRAKLFRTMIREQAQGGPNFAGSYTLAFWGCGSGCRLLAVVDARTGRVFTSPAVEGVQTSLYQTEDSLQFRKDSRLLIVTGMIQDARRSEKEGTFYLVWAGNKFSLIRYIRKKYPSEMLDAKPPAT